MLACWCSQSAWHYTNHFRLKSFTPCTNFAARFFNSSRPSGVYLHRAKWSPTCRRHFEMHFLKWKCTNFDYPKHYLIQCWPGLFIIGPLPVHFNEYYTRARKLSYKKKQIWIRSLQKGGNVISTSVIKSRPNSSWAPCCLCFWWWRYSKRCIFGSLYTHRQRTDEVAWMPNSKFIWYPGSFND